MRLSLAGIIAAVEPLSVTGAVSGVLDVFGVRADSRQVEPDDLYAALEDEGGRDRVADAVERGAAAVLAERPVAAPVPVLTVDSVPAALGRLAARHRLDAQALVAAVAGATGRTALARLLEGILESRFSVAGCRREPGDPLGLPLSLLAASGGEDVWIVEAGTSRPADMDDMAAIIQPDVAVLLDDGPGGAAAEQARLLDWIRLGGAAVVSADHPELWAEAIGREWGKERELIGFSTRRDAPSCVRYVGELLRAGDGPVRCRLEFDGRAVTVGLPRLDARGLDILLAAAAVAGRCGVTSEELPGLFEEALAREARADADAPAGGSAAAPLSGPARSRNYVTAIEATLAEAGKQDRE